MNLIFIYGAPGVGKLTVANELSAITGYALFHNHIAIDLVKPIYGMDGKRTEEMIRAVNISAITVASEKGADLIFTYARPNDTDFIKRAVDIVESYLGRVLFVELKCDNNTLQGRLSKRAGSTYSKISDRSALERFKKRYGPFGRIKMRQGMSIDTSKMPASQAAILIAKELEVRKSD